MMDVECPHVTAVHPLGGHALWLRFSDGVEGEVDLSDALDGPMFEPLRNPEFFATVRLEPPFTIGWPNGADIAPETLYQRLQVTGTQTKRFDRRAIDDAIRRDAADCAAMPELCRFFGIVIRMFWQEAEAPHFHAQYGDYVASIEIATGAVTTRKFPGQALRLVDDWRRQHVQELLENWRRMQDGQPPDRIAPLE